MRRGGGHTWQSCYKAAAGVGRPQLQALSEINHPCCPLLAFPLSPSLLLLRAAVLSIPALSAARLRQSIPPFSRSRTLRTVLVCSRRRWLECLGTEELQASATFVIVISCNISLFFVMAESPIKTHHPSTPPRKRWFCASRRGRSAC